MKQVLTVEQMQLFDRTLINGIEPNAVELMEKASGGVFANVFPKALQVKKAVIVCGPGNNGGDGFAVARMLKTEGIDTIVYCLDRVPPTPEARFEKEKAIRSSCEFRELFQLDKRDLEGSVVVDALFGTGLSREISNDFGIVIEQINASGAYVVSIDIPSGVNGNTGKIMGHSIRADQTICLQNLKPGLVLQPGRSRSGEIIVHPLTNDSVEFLHPYIFLQEFDDVHLAIPDSDPNSNKGRNGKVCIFGGSKKYIGAPILCSSAAIRTGSGLTYAVIPSSVRELFVRLPEIISMPVGTERSDCWDRDALDQAVKFLNQINPEAICIGPGMNRILSDTLILEILKKKIPAVMDADCLNYLSAHRDLLMNLNKKTVLTPHPGEMSRLTGLSVESIVSDCISVCREYASKWNCILLLKGPTSCISDGKTVILNQTGHEGLAKGGSGDALSGIICALLGFGMDPFDAARCGSYLLGESAEKAYELLGKRMMIASDFISVIRSTAEGHSI